MAGLKGNNLHHQVLVLPAIPAQSIAAATVNGTALAEPQKKCGQLGIISLCGAFASTASGRLKVQGLLRSDGTTWEDVQDLNAVDLEFPAAKFDDAGAAENGALLGTIPMADWDGETYKSIRVQFIAETAVVAQLVAVGFVLFDLQLRPSGQTDELFLLVHED